MFDRRRISLVFLWLGLALLLLGMPSRVHAFPLRIDEDCFYGEGEPTGDGLSSWMGYAVQFDPPYTPYTVDGVSLYISQMLLSPSASRRLQVSVLDDAGVRRQYSSIDWRELEGHQGWVLIDLANKEYVGPFTIIVHSGVGLTPSVSVPVDAVFKLGVDTTEPEVHSLVYTSDSPPPAPPVGQHSRGEIERQAQSNIAKLVPVSSAVPGFPGGNWMIRAHAPGLQTESTRIVITMEDIARLYYTPEIPSPEWHLPPIEPIGSRGMVRCPTSMVGVTFYYWQDDPEKKFLIPQDGPMVNRELVNALAGLCSDLSGEGIVGIEHIGIYNDRNIRGTNVRSSHAYALGIDISGFQYADGHVVMVRDHDDPEVRRVLEHIRDDHLKKHFTTVLDWHYQDHDNHFHVNLPYAH